MASGFVETADRTRLFVKERGSGRPVILLSGWPLSADSWDDQAMAIADAGYRAIAYDRRGFGRSSQPPSGYNYDTLADDLAAVIRATGVDNAVLVGFSMGGGEVARYLSRHEGKAVARTVLVSSILPYMLKTPDNPNGTAQEAFDQMALAIGDDRARFFSGFFRKFFGVSTISQPVSEEFLLGMQAIAMQAGLQATLECARAFSTTDFRSELTAFKVPTLIIHGSADKTVPIEAAGRAAVIGIPGSRLKQYDNAPHGLPATHKHRLTQDLLEFIGQ